MNLDEFSFFNQQLAAMLQEGIPLEQGLKQLGRSMREGKTRAELEMLEADLAAGLPLEKALELRTLPDFYKRMLVVGARGNNLPGMLLLLADYYARLHSVAARLKGLMVYPCIVLLVATILSVFLAYFLTTGARTFFSEFGRASEMTPMYFAAWCIPAIFGLVAAVVLVIACVPALRGRAVWALPGFKEASLSRFAQAMCLILRGGGNLDEALSLMQLLEQGTPAGDDVQNWRKRLGSGYCKFSDLSVADRAFPPLFVWLVSHDSEDLAAGFARAADIYYARAVHRVEMVLYAALPVSVLILGVLIFTQFAPIFLTLVRLMDAIGDMGGGKK